MDYGRASPGFSRCWAVLTRCPGPTDRPQARSQTRSAAAGLFRSNGEGAVSGLPLVEPDVSRGQLTATGIGRNSNAVQSDRPSYRIISQDAVRVSGAGAGAERVSRRINMVPR